MIDIKNLSYIYKSNNKMKVALHNVRLNIKKGDFISIVGHNGSGKSTLAKEINALLFPTTGKVFINNMDTSDDKNLFDIRSTIGMVFQNPDNQIVSTIVEEDIAFGPENIGISIDEITKRINNSLQAVNMIDFKTAFINKLSGGQKQQIAIAGVLAMQPSCIVFDEPTSMLDFRGRDRLLKTMYKLNNEYNVTIILITHNMEETVNSDKIIVMEKGHILSIGTPKEIFSNVEFLYDKHIEMPVITKIAYEFEKNGINIKRGIFDRRQLINEIIKLKKYFV